MSQTHRVLVVGADARRVAVRLEEVGITDVGVFDETPAASVFDECADAWAVRMPSGRELRAGVVIHTQPPLTPWIPELPGGNAFRGSSFHAARWDADFDPAGRHVAVIGADATAGHYLGGLVDSAASVTVFAHAPRRIVHEVPLPTTRVARWLRRHTLPAPRTSRPAAALVGSAIDEVTASGLRTRDGALHRADVIVYGTGFTTRDESLVGVGGVTLSRTWADGMEPYLGVAVRGFPNQFFITGPDRSAQVEYVSGYLRLLERTSSTRIEVRRSTQQVFNERVYPRPARPHPVTHAYELSSDAHDPKPAYRGAATLTISGTGHPVRVQLAGQLNPIDGHYHWRGTILDPLPDGAAKERSATLTVGARSAPARIVEQTPWGTHSVAGVGEPPFECTQLVAGS